MKKSGRLIILGSGPAGCTASIYAARAKLDPIVITGNLRGGQLMNAHSVENWPGDHRNVSGFALMDRMIEHASIFGAEIVSDHVETVDFCRRPFYLKGENHTYHCDSVIVATGASAKRMGISSEEMYEGRGVSYCAICDGFFFRDKTVVIVGGGSTAVEEALYLSNIAKKIHLVHRRENFSAEKISVLRLEKKIKSGSIILHKNSTIEEILGDGTRVTHVVLKTDSESRSVQTDGIFVAIGYSPNSKPFEDQIVTRDGYIIVGTIERWKTSTSIPGIFAAGDIADRRYRQAITSAGSGCMAALDAEDYLNNLQDGEGGIFRSVVCSEGG